MKKFREILRKILITKKSDNREGVGFAVIALACMGIFFLAWLGINNLFSDQGRKGTVESAMASPNLGKSQVDVSRAAAVATSDQAPAPKEEEKNDITSSDRIKAPKSTIAAPVSEADEMIDTVRISTTPKKARVSQDANGTDDTDEGRSALQPSSNAAHQESIPDTPPLYGKAIVHPGNAGSDTSSLIVYAGDPIDTPASRAKTRANAKVAPFGEMLLPTGTEFPVIFLDKIQTLDLEGLVRLRVVGHVRSPTGKVLIPDGTLIYGHAAKKNVRSRVAVTLGTIVYESGKELTINAILKDRDGQPGVIGEYYPEPGAVDAIDTAIPAITGFLDSKKDTTQTAYGVVANQFSPRNASLDAAQTAVITELSKKRAELSELGKAYTEVGKGTLAFVQILGPSDFDEKKKDEREKVSPVSTNLIDKIKDQIPKTSKQQP